MLEEQFQSMMELATWSRRERNDWSSKICASVEIRWQNSLNFGMPDVLIPAFALLPCLAASWYAWLSTQKTFNVPERTSSYALARLFWTCELRAWMAKALSLALREAFSSWLFSFSALEMALGILRSLFLPVICTLSAPNSSLDLTFVLD